MLLGQRRASSARMLSSKKTKNKVSKPAEVQGKYVKKEMSPLQQFQDGLISVFQIQALVLSQLLFQEVSRNQSFLRTPVQRTPHEVMRRERNRLSAPSSYLVRSLADVPREYGSSQSFLTEVNFAVENGDSGFRYFDSDNFFDGQRRRPHGDRAQEDCRCYEYNHDLFQRMPTESGEAHFRYWESHCYIFRKFN